MTSPLMPYLRRLITGSVLSEEEAHAFFLAVLDGHANDVELASMLTALALRGEDLGEIVGAVRAMRDRMVAVTAPKDTIDVCGTGGDGRHTLNISTAVSFVLAGCGVKVAKHGNRALTSRAGAADVLTALGVNIDPPIERLSSILDDAGIVFLFAPNHHPGLLHAGPVRKKLGFRTIFNLLGPLASPAMVRHQLIGVFDAERAALLAQAAGALGAQHVWVVHSAGTDELSLAGKNQICIWYQGQLRQFNLMPEECGFARVPLERIAGGDALYNAQAIVDLLDGVSGPYRDTVLLNAAAGLMVAQRCSTMIDGISMAARAIDQGFARGALNRLRERSTVS